MGPLLQFRVLTGEDTETDPINSRGDGRLVNGEEIDLLIQRFGRPVQLVIGYGHDPVHTYKVIIELRRRSPKPEVDYEYLRIEAIPLVNPVIKMATPFILQFFSEDKEKQDVAKLLNHLLLFKTAFIFYMGSSQDRIFDWQWGIRVFHLR